MAFIETPRFPDALSYWMEGGGGFNTGIVRTSGGNEYRNAYWDQELGEWTVKGEALRTVHSASTEYFVPLRNLFKVSRAQWGAFRFKDHSDFQDETGGVLGTTGLGVASTTAYQVFKNYGISPAAYQRLILKPVGSTIKVYIAGVLKTLTTDYTIAAATGIITFTSQPTVGAALTWTGEFDVPARFGSDMQNLGPDASGAMYDWSQLRVVEVRNV